MRRVDPARKTATSASVTNTGHGTCERTGRIGPQHRTTVAARAITRISANEVAVATGRPEPVPLDAQGPRDIALAGETQGVGRRVLHRGRSGHGSAIPGSAGPRA